MLKIFHPLMSQEILNIFAFANCHQYTVIIIVVNTTQFRKTLQTNKMGKFADVRCLSLIPMICYDML